MTLFKKSRSDKAQTRIVTRPLDKVMDTTPQQALVSIVLHTQRWEAPRREPFQGFDSPPGRF